MSRSGLADHVIEPIQLHVVAAGNRRCSITAAVQRGEVSRVGVNFDLYGDRLCRCIKSNDGLRPRLWIKARYGEKAWFRCIVADNLHPATQRRIVAAYAGELGDGI